ncbi:hypothetical protein AAMO2058_001202700 [Amorphochlora amoebiformis]
MRKYVTSLSLALNLVLVAVFLRAYSAPNMAGRASPIATRTSSRILVANAEAGTGRRAMGAVMGVGVPSVAARNAMALIMDDDDAELVAKAKANRKARIAEEKKIENEFLRAEGFTNKAERIELVPITRAVARLADLGKSIAENNVVSASSYLANDGGNGGWIEPLIKKVGDLSDNNNSKASAMSLVSSIESLTKAASAKDVSKLKVGYINTVSALEKWAVDADVAAFLRAQ